MQNQLLFSGDGEDALDPLEHSISPENTQGFIRNTGRTQSLGKSVNRMDHLRNHGRQQRTAPRGSLTTVEGGDKLL